MKVKKKPDGWWIIDLPYECGDCGPYDTKEEAEEEKTGLQRSFDNLDNRKFWTSEKK
jgi:hypothetical protein